MAIGSTAPNLFVQRARELRRRQTRAETVLWKALRGRQLANAKFRRQHRFCNYICDFYCAEARLVVECDGSWHDTPGQRERDAQRDRVMRAHGMIVLRFRNEHIFNDLNAVLREITAHLPYPELPSPQAEKGRG
jgi:very-short-patch-repair endonuclease